MTEKSSNAQNVIQSLLFHLKSYTFSKGSPNRGTFQETLYTENAPQLSERHFGEVPSGIEPL